MTERNRELLSAYLDGELDAQESAELSHAWRRSPELRGVADRYATVGELMRSRRGVPVGRTDVAERVRARMAEELAPDGEFARALAAHETTPGSHTPGSADNIVRPRFGRVTKTVGSLALAASVAAVAIVGVRQINPSDAEGGNAIAVVDAIPVQRASQTAGPQLGWTGEQPAVQPGVQRRLNAYLVQHSEVSGRGRGMLPYARIVGYEPPRD